MRRAFGTADFFALCVGQFLAHQTALTFSVLIPILTTEWRLSASQAGFILGGFQFGTLVAYVIVGFLLDRVRSKPIMVWSAVLVGVGDLLFALGGGNFISGFMLRLVVGVLFGGLYLPALKHIAETISLERRGTATGLYIGMVVGAYAAPLFYVGLLAPRLGWRSTMAGVAALELLGALLMAWKVRDMPRPEGVISGILQYLSDVLRNPPARRVILAYTGHNWELFGMWGWLTPFMVASLVARGGSQSQALAWGGLLAAGAIGAGGGAGAVAGGRLSDRLGRARAASIMLTLSLACSLTFGWLFRAPLALLTGVAVIYGFASLADSPSYSARLMEVVPPRSLGGAFSLQMLTGWAATAVAPPLFGAVLDATASRASSPAQWGWAFTLLAVGPLVGIIALLPLREARRAVRPGAETPQISRARPQ